MDRHRTAMRGWMWAAPVLLCLATTGTALAQPHEASFDHGVFDSLLRTHVTEEGLVDYGAFASAPDLEAYLEALAGVSVDEMDEPDQLALWINAYNAYTIELILRHEERSSIRNINKTLWVFSGRGPWNERLAHVGGEVYTLDEIEHEIIREDFDEPRIHFALVCAALGCPPLRREAYTGGRLDAQLSDQARHFLNEAPAKNRVDVEDGTVYLSRVFDWYREDFPEGDSGLGAFLAPYVDDLQARAFLMAGDFDVEHTKYDWALNAAP